MDTDSAGSCTIEYSRTLSGAGLGETRVSISTKVAFPDEDTSSFEPNKKTGEREKKELVPAKYNKQSELIIEVTAGGAPYNFGLQSN